MSKETEHKAAAKAAHAETGTARVLQKGKPIIPAPPIPVYDQRILKPYVKAKEKNQAHDVVVPAQHIIDSFAKGTSNNRLIRLKELSRKNRDVAWLLSEREPKKPAKHVASHK